MQQYWACSGEGSGRAAAQSNAQKLPRDTWSRPHPSNCRKNGAGDVVNGKYTFLRPATLYILCRRSSFCDLKCRSTEK